MSRRRSRQAPGELTETRSSSYAAIISADPRVQGGGAFGVIWTDVPLGAQVNGSTITLSG